LGFGIYKNIILIPNALEWLPKMLLAFA